MNRYEIQFYVNCPNDDDEVLYSLVIESEEIIMTERINEVKAACEKNEDGAYHEVIADLFYSELGCVQTITAVHQGVTITTTRGDGITHKSFVNNIADLIDENQHNLHYASMKDGG